MLSTATDELGLLKAEYLHELSQYTNAKTQSVKMPQPGRKCTKALQSISSQRQHFLSHLEDLRLQKKYEACNIIAHYASKADEIARDGGIYSLPPMEIAHKVAAEICGQEDSSLTEQHQVDALVESRNAGVTDLELALVKARQQLKHEKTLLGHTKAQQNRQGNHFSDQAHLVTKLRALEATRDELQCWIGDVLARCEQESGGTDESNSDTTRIQTQVLQRDGTLEIADVYEQYIHMRKRLARIVQALRTPLPLLEFKMAPLASATPKKQHATNEKKPIPLHSSQKPQELLHSRSDYVTIPSLADIESLYLPQYEHERTLALHTTSLQQQTRTQDTRLLQALSMLSRESHLLPSHPLHTQRHEGDDGSDIDDLLRAWSHASEIAASVVHAAVESNLDTAKTALAKATTSNQEMYVMDEMKKQVFREA